MNRTFNDGIGMAIVIDAAHSQALKATLEAQGERVYEIGVIVDQSQPRSSPTTCRDSSKRISDLESPLMSKRCGTWR
jgi:hypothetical protein